MGSIRTSDVREWKCRMVVFDVVDRAIYKPVISVFFEIKI